MKKLLKKIRKSLMKIRDEFQEAADNRASIIIRKYRCGQNAEFLTKLIKEIDKKIK